MTTSQGCRNTLTRKKNKTDNGSNGIVSMVMTQEDTNAHRFLYSIAKQREHHMITKDSLEYHSVIIGTDMDVHGFSIGH